MPKMPRKHRALLPIIPSLFLGATSIYLFYQGNFTYTPSRFEFDTYLEGGLPPEHRKKATHTTARVDAKYFWDKRKETSCFHLDSICHSDDEWFYRRTDRTKRHQPTITYVQDNVTFTHGYIKSEPRIYFNISSKSVTAVDEDRCPMDPVPFHMIVQSAYNDMMGEFYSRSLVALNQLLQDNPIPSGSYYTDLQMYLHVVEKNKHKLLEGHRLFLSGLPNNDKFDSFLSMLSNNSCQCFEKLVFCGYQLKPASLYIPANKSSAIPFNNMPMEYKNENAKVFRPVGHITSQKTVCTRKTSGKNDLLSKPCFSYQSLRQDIYETYALKDADLSRKIMEYRRNILIQKEVVGNATLTANEVNKWKFVGLTMRKKRRVWLNIDESISLCDDEFRKEKVVCLTVDVEDADSPEKQLLMHRSLHSIIGVHGAQLTQGVLLPPHGKILELLPWIPSYLNGNWVQWTNRPTPLGIIYHKTNLNHFGYKLDRYSVPLCLNVSRSEEEECFMSRVKGGNLKKFQWATRDFNVPPGVIHNFIEQFILNSSSVCNEMEMRAEQHDFVLYNAYCRADANTTKKFHVEHYFRDIENRKDEM